MVGSGQYLFRFKLLKNSFEYSLSCLQHYRLRANLRSLEWSWTDKTSFYSKDSKKSSLRVAQLVIGDSEEGVSFYTYDQKSNSLKIRGFDIGIKQIVYARGINETNLVACLDYQGTFSILGDLQGNVNPLLRLNKETLYSHSFNQLIRKFEYT